MFHPAGPTHHRFCLSALAFNTTASISKVSVGQSRSKSYVFSKEVKAVKSGDCVSSCEWPVQLALVDERNEEQGSFAFFGTTSETKSRARAAKGPVLRGRRDVC